MTPHDAEHRGETKPPPGELGREERFEEARLVLRGDSHASVGRFEVRVLPDNGGFEFAGVTHTSLTAIAKAITGAKSISGPRFFGVDQKGGAA